MSEGPATLEALVEQRRDRDQLTQVYITGTGRHFPEDVAATAREVAEMIAGDDGDILESDFDELDEDDVALIKVERARMDQSADGVNEFSRLASVARASALGGIVGYTDAVDVPAAVLPTLDAVVEVDEHGVDFIGRVHTRHPGGDFYKVELNGIAG